MPPARAYNEPVSLEEERRRMYVAATRGKAQVIMWYPGQGSVPVWQLSDIVYRTGLSFFIKDLPEDVASRESAGIRKTSFGRQLYEKSSFDNHLDQRESIGFSQGDRVSHPAFGPGVVSKFVSNDKVDVLLRNAGRKLLHLEYTTLETLC